MKRFEAKAVYMGTNRRRTVRRCAVDEDAFRVYLLINFYIEPFIIFEIPMCPPTSKQIKDAALFKIPIPQGASSEDVTALIYRRTLHDSSDPHPELLQYALDNGMCESQHIGKKHLYNLIFLQLYGKPKLAFFIFCVYRFCSDDRRGNLGTHPHNPVFYSIADELSENEAYVDSVSKYRGEDLRFFGTMRVGKNVYNGGSVDTVAYEITCAKLLEKLGVEKRVEYTKEKSTNDERMHPSQNGATSSSPEMVYFDVPLKFISKMNFKRKSVVTLQRITMFCGSAMTILGLLLIEICDSSSFWFGVAILMLLFGVALILIFGMLMKYVKNR